MKLNKTVIKPLAIAGVSLALGLLFDYLFFEQIPGLSFLIYVALITGGIAVLARALHHRVNAQVWWLAVPLLGFAAMVAVRTSVALTLLNIGACILLLLLISRVAFRRSLTGMRIGEYLRLPFLPLQFLAPAARTLTEIVTAPKAYRDRPLVRQVLRGIVITVPVLVIFLLLFASADLVVHKFVTDLFSFQLDDEIVGRLILISLATVAFIGAYSYLFGRTEPESEPGSAVRKPVLGTVESTILFASVNALFLGFILVQLAYLFGGQANLAGQDYTYAEYARKGFFELLAVGIIALILLWAAEKYVTVREKGHTLLFKVLSTALIAQVLVVMVSALRRLHLYEQAYGFTTLRLFSHAFTFLLGVVFLILAYKIIRSASDKVFVFPAFLAVIAFLAAMNLLNPDAFIARQNLQRFDETGKVDAYYLSRLSEDAVPVIVRHFESLPDDEKKLLQVSLIDRSGGGTNRYSDWQSWNLSRQLADQALANVD